MKIFSALLALILAPLMCRGAPSVALNDEFATREILSGPLPLQWSGYARELTADVADARAVCGMNLDDCDLYGTMWFEWTVPETGVYEMTWGAPFGMAVFQAGSPTANQVPEHSQEIAVGWDNRPLLLEGTAGQRLWLMLMYDGGPITSDTVSLEISRAVLAPATKETAAVLPSTPTVNIRQAVRGTGWWRWTAPYAGFWRARSNNYTLPIEVWRANGNAATTGYAWPFAVAAGEEIFFRGGGPLVWIDTVLEPLVPAPNSTPETALPLVPDASGNRAELFFESGGFLPDATSTAREWFSWVAPRDGLVAFAASQTSLAIETYRDDNGTLTQIDAGDAFSRNPYVMVSAGRRYLISAGAGVSWLVRVEYFEGRGSDSFAGAPPLTQSGMTRDLFGDSTVEPGEPGVREAGERTRWWTYTPATDGLLDLEFVYRANLYTGDSLGSLTRVAAIDSTPGHLLYLPVAPAQAGTVYHLQVFESTQSPWETVFGLIFLPKTPHDNFANALPLAASPFPGFAATRLSLVRATAEAGEPPATPGVPAARTAWLRWTADADVRIMLAQQAYFLPQDGSNRPQPVYAVWKGNTLASLERVPLLPFLQSFGGPVLPSFDAVAGTVYSIQVETPADGTAIEVNLVPVIGDVDALDSFASALPVERVIGTGGWANAPTRRATFEPGESTAGLPAPPNGYSSGSYWLRWTAPATGVWRFAPDPQWYENAEAPVSPVITLYGESLAGGRLGLMSVSQTESIYLKLQAGEHVHFGNIVMQWTSNAGLAFYPLIPEISPAVPGIALAKWYGLPSPANLNAAYSSDGMPLLVKHALGLDPLRNSLPGGDDPNAARWPLLTLTADGEPALAFRTAAPFETGAGVDLAGEISRDLRTWQPAPETSGAGGRTARVPRDGGKGFLRLRAALR